MERTEDKSRNCSNESNSSHAKQADSSLTSSILIQAVLCIRNEPTYRLLQAVGQMYEFFSTNELHNEQQRNCLVVIGSNLNEDNLREQFRKCIQ